MRIRALIAGGLVLFLAGCGITGNFRNDPGYAAFGSPGPLATDREFGISIGPLPLKLARWALEDDAELAPLLKDLRAVRVYTYEVTGDAEVVAGRVREAQSELLGEGWLAVAIVRDHDDSVAVLLRPGERGSNAGLAVIVQEPQEVVFVNLIGDVRLEFINDYLADLDVGVPSIEIDPATLQAHAR